MERKELPPHWRAEVDAIKHYYACRYNRPKHRAPLRRTSSNVYVCENYAKLIIPHFSTIIACPEDFDIIYPGDFFQGSLFKEANAVLRVLVEELVGCRFDKDFEYAANGTRILSADHNRLITSKYTVFEGTSRGDVMIAIAERVFELVEGMNTIINSTMYDPQAKKKTWYGPTWEVSQVDPKYFYAFTAFETEK